MKPEDLERLEGEATKGPWVNSPSMGIIQTAHLTRDVWTIPRVDVDLALIVALRNAAPGLLALWKAAKCGVEDSYLPPCPLSGARIENWCPTCLALKALEEVR